MLSSLNSGLLTHIPAMTIAVRQYCQSHHMIHVVASVSPVCGDYKAHFSAVNTKTYQPNSPKNLNKKINLPAAMCYKKKNPEGKAGCKCYNSARWGD